MAKEKFDIIQSTCIPIEIDNNNTDNIIPARYLAFTTRDPTLRTKYTSSVIILMPSCIACAFSMMVSSFSLVF